MAYTINKTDGTVVATVQDGTLNTQTTIPLLGRNYAGYGEVVAENFVKLLENSAKSTAPTNPITGELWFDTSTSALKVYDGSYFQYINSVRPQTTAPTQSLRTGVLWYDTTNIQLKLYNGSTWVVMGPTTILDEDDMASDSASAVPSQQSVKAYVDDVVIAQNTLPITDDASNSISVDFVNGVHIRGDAGIVTRVDQDSTAGVAGAKRVNISLDTTIEVNTISSSDSTYVRINDSIETENVKANGTLTVTGTATIGSLSVSGNRISSTDSSVISLGGQQLSNIADPTQASDAATKSYVDAQVSSLSAVSITQGDTSVSVADSGSGTVTTTVDGDSKIVSNATDTTFSQPVVFASDLGITVGEDSDVTLTQSGANFTLKNTTEDGNILINVNDGGVDTTAITVNGGDYSVAMAGNLTVTGNLTVSGTTTTVNSTTTTIADPLIVLNKGASVVSGYDAGIIIDRGIGDSSAQQNATMLWDESANEFAFAYTQDDGTTAGNVTISQYADLHVSEVIGAATSAYYADLAERYEADVPMDIGDCVKIGGAKEITKTNQEYDTDVFGVIAENPAFKMNSDAGNDDTHPYVTLTGRTVCKVQGPITKGDRICASDVPGVAKKCDINNEKFHTLAIIGRSLGNHATTDVAMIEVVLGRN